MNKPLIGSDYVRRPSFLEQRDTSGSFAQALPQMTRFDEALQEALLARVSGDAGDRIVGWVSAAAGLVLVGLIAAGCV